MLLTILIPTRNRARHLRRNCELLAEHIRAQRLGRVVGVLVSNNASTDDTAAVLDAFAAESSFAVRVVHQSHNVGFAENCLFLLREAQTSYVMFLGDDDYISARYLADVCERLTQDPVDCILPSIRAIGLDGRPTGFGRDLARPIQKYPAGFRNCLHQAWRGHQFSGVVFRREGLAQACLERDVRNLYVFVFLVAYACLRGPSLHLTAEPVDVTSAPQSAKEWTYGHDGLLSDVFDNFYRLHELTARQRFLLEQRFLDRQYWRYAMYLKLGPRAFFRCLLAVSQDRKATLGTRAGIFVMAPVYMAKNALSLLLTGQLVRTLFRGVEI